MDVSIVKLEISFNVLNLEPLARLMPKWRWRKIQQYPTMVVLTVHPRRRQQRIRPTQTVKMEKNMKMKSLPERKATLNGDSFPPLPPLPLLFFSRLCCQLCGFVFCILYIFGIFRYTDVIAAADMIDQSPVRGCVVIKPWGMSIWDNIRVTLDAKIKLSGAENAYFPLLIPLSFMEKEAAHVEGFAKECAVVTHHRLCANPIADTNSSSNKNSKTMVKNQRVLIPDPSAELEVSRCGVWCGV